MYGSRKAKRRVGPPARRGIRCGSVTSSLGRLYPHEPAFWDYKHFTGSRCLFPCLRTGRKEARGLRYFPSSGKPVYFSLLSLAHSHICTLNPPPGYENFLFWRTVCLGRGTKDTSAVGCSGHTAYADWGPLDWLWCAKRALSLVYLTND